MSKATSFADAVRTVELAAERIYRKQAVSISDPRASWVFEKLADDEARHAVLAESLARLPSGVSAFGAGNKVVGELIAFMIEQSEAVGRRLEAANTEWERFEAALGMEKDSVLLYASLISRTGNAPLRKQVERVLRQEKDHFEELWRMRSSPVFSQGTKGGPGRSRGQAENRSKELAPAGARGAGGPAHGTRFFAADASWGEARTI